MTGNCKVYICPPAHKGTFETAVVAGFDKGDTENNVVGVNERRMG